MSVGVEDLRTLIFQQSVAVDRVRIDDGAGNSLLIELLVRKDFPLVEYHAIQQAVRRAKPAGVDVRWIVVYEGLTVTPVATTFKVRTKTTEW